MRFPRPLAGALLVGLVLVFGATVSLSVHGDPIECFDACSRAATSCHNECPAGDPVCNQHCDDTKAACKEACTPKPAPVDWASLTATTLAAVTRDQMAAAKTADLASIPAAACAGFTPSLVDAIGMNDPQPFDPKHDPNTQCSGFTPACLQSIPPTAFVSMRFSCIQSLSASQFVALKADQIAQLPADALKTITPAQLGQINPPACAGFTAAQMPSIIIDQCSGWTPACMAYVQPETVASMYPCAQYFTDATLQSLSNAQLAAMPCREYADLWQVQWSKLSPAQCVDAKVACTGTAHIGAAAGISPACWTAASPANYVGLGSPETRNAQPHSFDKINGDQFKGFTFGAVQALGENLATLPAAACAVMSADQGRGLTSCELMSPECIIAMPPDAFTHLECIGDNPCPQHFNPAAYARLSAAQIAAIPDYGFDGLHTVQTAAWGATQCSGIRAMQMDKLTSGCDGLKPVCLKAIPVDVFAGLGSTLDGGRGAMCVSQLTNLAVMALSLEQVLSLPPVAYKGWTGDHLAHLVKKWGTQFFDLISLGQADAILSETEGSTWLAASIADGSLPLAEMWNVTTDFTTRSAINLAMCKPTCMAALFGTNSSANSLPTASWVTLRPDHVQAITPDQIATFADSTTSVAAWLQWPANAVSALSGPQVARIGVPEFFALASNTLNALSVDTMAYITDDQLESLPADHLTPSDIDCPHFLGFTADQFNILEDMTSQGAKDLVAACGGKPTTPKPKFDLEVVDSLFIATQ